jgi:hypothetical protein
MLKKFIGSLLELVSSNRAMLTLGSNGILWLLSLVHVTAITNAQTMMFLDVTLGALLVSYGFRAPGVDKEIVEPVADKLLPPSA